MSDTPATRELPPDPTEAIHATSGSVEAAGLVRAALVWVPFLVVFVAFVTGFAPGPGPLLVAIVLGLMLPFVGREVQRDGWLGVGALFGVAVIYYEVTNPLEYLIDPALPIYFVDNYTSLSADQLTRPLIGTLIGACSFLVGYHLTAFGRPDPLPPRPVDADRLLRLAALMLSVGLGLYVLMGRVVTGSWMAYFFLSYRERNEAWYGHGSLGFGIYLVYAAIAVIAATMLFRPSTRREKVLLALLYVLVVALSLLTGQKMHFFQAAMGLLVALTLSPVRRRMARAKRRRSMLAIGSLVVLTLVVIGAARGKQGEGASAMYEQVTSRFEFHFLNPANIDSYGPYITLVDTMAQDPPKLYGKSYLDSLQILLPRFLSPERPAAISETFAIDYLGMKYYDNATFGFSPVAEGYANFGFLGVGLQYLVMGLVLGRLRRYVHGSPAALERTALFAVLAPWVVLVLRSPVAAILKGPILLLMCPVLVLVWYSRERERAGTPKPAPSIESP